MTPLCTRIYTHPFFEATPPGAAPGPPVKNRVPVFATSGGVTNSLRQNLKLALLISVFVLLNCFGKWGAQSAPTPRTSSILATRLVRTEGKVEAHRESPRVLSCLTLAMPAMDGGFVWLGL